MGEKKTFGSVGDLLKNALQWKQWLADDLRLLVQMKKDEEVGVEAFQELLTHHLQTYELVNQTYSFVTEDQDEPLFDLPNLEYLQKIIPTLDVDQEDIDRLIEPMLELELESLSSELKNEAEALTHNDDGVVAEDTEEDECPEEDSGRESDVDISSDETMSESDDVVDESPSEDDYQAQEDKNPVEEIDEDDASIHSIPSSLDYFRVKRTLSDQPEDVLKKLEDEESERKQHRRTEDIVSKLWDDVSSDLRVGGSSEDKGEGDVDVDGEN